MSHANALLTPRARLRLARLVVEDGWTYQALPGWLHFYNHHRAHSATGGRLNNLPGHHS